MSPSREEAKGLVGNRGPEESVDFFHYLYTQPRRRDDAVSLQRALAAHHPDTLELMFGLWLEDKRTLAWSTR
uniref:RxLR effector candidate protein n=1 Tax=Hyaloperonospora arabidopsidis (strain Emoy2) TaxID=559515 RepID=M4BMK4_HYAAE